MKDNLRKVKFDIFCVKLNSAATFIFCQFFFILYIQNISKLNNNEFEKIYLLSIFKQEVN